MAISIRTAVKNIFTERYNKVNVLYFSIIMAVAVITGFFINSQPQSQTLSALIKTNSIALLISICAFVVVIGIYLVAVNNGYNEKDSIFPNLITDFKAILLSGVQFYAAMILLHIIIFVFALITVMLIMPMFFMKLALPKMLVLAFLAIIIIGFMLLFFFIILLVCGLIFNFTKTLSFEDLINVKKAYSLIVSGKKELCIYVLKSIALNLALFLLIAVIFTIVVFIFGIVGGIKGMLNDFSEIQVLAIMGTFCIIYYVFVSLFQIDLERQYLIETKKYEN